MTDVDATPPAIPAATVVLVRSVPRGDGIETLMLLKNTGHAFGDMWVFPGGRVDAADGSPDTVPDRDRAARAAAREAHEEAGMVLTPADLVPFAHWTPPPESPRRFATWFFIAEVGGDIGDVVIDGAEIVDHIWTTPRDALARHAEGAIELATPTWITLHWLDRHGDTTAVIDAAVRGQVSFFATRIAMLDGAPVAMWDGDAGYESVDATATGTRHRLVMGKSRPWSYERSVREA